MPTRSYNTSVRGGYTSTLSSGRSRRRSQRSVNGLAIAALLAIFLGIFAVGGVLYVATKGEETFTITDKAIKRSAATSDSPGSDQYLIYTDHGTFKNTDTIFALKFRSSDLYGRLQVGKKYHCTTSGLRIPFTSSFKNLIDCDPA